jgi:hypothetical protein
MTAAARAGAARLALVRTLAWAMLFGGWLVLGRLGRQHLPLWAGGQLPIALWLATIGALLALAARWPCKPPTLRVVQVGAGAVAGAAGVAAGHAAGTMTAVMLMALAWGVLLVAVSTGVRALRLAQSGTPPAPLLPAAGGALLACVVAGELGDLRGGSD